jgi:hypothetical protein
MNHKPNRTASLDERKEEMWRLMGPKLKTVMMTKSSGEVSHICSLPIVVIDLTVFPCA